MADQVIAFIAEQGYLAIVVLMFLENLFPPLPSELIMPFAGFVASRGDLHPALVVLCGAAGSLLGAYPWYVAGRKLGVDRLKHLAEHHGRWVTMTPADIDLAEHWFRCHGPSVLVFGRLVPALRTVISLPAGLSRLHVLPFSLWTLLGSLLWCSVLTGAGYLLESQYERIARWLNPLSTAVLVGLVLTYVWRVLRHPRAARRTREVDQRDGSRPPA